MGDLKDKDWKLEQERVHAVVHVIDKKMNKLLINAGSVSADVLELRKTFWEDVTVNLDEPDDIIETAASMRQQAALLSERERSHNQLGTQLKTLQRLKDSPYFGRIDFWEEGEKTEDKVYLGIASLMDEKDENFLIYDWRAPISSLYYDYPPGPAQYQTPEGCIQGEMKLKRQFIIRASKIKGMFETGVTIVDEMLQEVLGAGANSQMKSIVATIQREQNAIIRNDRSRLLIVQGVAGSGKTSAALQRVAYLLYRFRGTLKSENIMLFSPNPLFNSYVATVLPELGEENMQQATFQEYLLQRLGKEYAVEDPFTQIEYLLSAKEDRNYQTRVIGIRFKASLDFKKIIDTYVTQLSEYGIIFKDLPFRGDILISKRVIHDYFYSLERSFSIPNRLQLVKEWLIKELKRWVRRELSKSWVEEEIQYLEKEDYLDVYKKLQAKQQFTENTFDDFEQEQRLLAEMIVKERFKPLFILVKNLRFIDMPEIYLQMYYQERNFANRIPAHWEQIKEQTIRLLENRVLPYEDTTPYVYLQDLLEGEQTDNSIRHIFIDEAQDYTPFQFAFIKKLFPYSKITLLGDFNQAIFSGATGAESVITELAGEGDDTETFILTRTYRSTKQIVEFTRELIENGKNIIPFNRTGKKPTATFINKNELKAMLTAKINQLQKEGHRTIAVICKTAEESKAAFTLIRDEISVNLIEKATLSYEKGILIIPSYLAKGIEFDAVIVYDISQYYRERERKLFYTVCTRAMHELHLFALQGISPLMKNIASETYTIEKS